MLSLPFQFNVYMSTRLFFAATLALLTLLACQQADSGHASGATQTEGLKIAYVNGDTILHKFEEFRRESEVMEAKQRKLEEELQTKGAALEKEIMAYQKKAQSGTMTGKEMEAKERYLASQQESLLKERDRMAQSIMEETQAINTRLQAVLHEKLDAIKEKEGYDFILSYVEGGAILSADEKYDITDRILTLLNEGGATTSDTSGQK